MADQIGETPRLVATITDVDNDSVDPPIVTISINKPNKVVDVVTVAMTNPAVGSYYYDYLIPDITGTYNWKVTATGSGGRVTIGKTSFTVEKSI